MKFVLAALVAALTIPAAASAGVTIQGGTPSEQAVIPAALAAAIFPWQLAGDPTITITTNPADTYNHAGWSTPGHVWISALWLDEGASAFFLVQHEMAHQVDYNSLTDVQRAQLDTFFGVAAWSGDETGSDVTTTNSYGGERFAEELTSVYGVGPDSGEVEWKPPLDFDTELVTIGLLPATLLHHPKLVCKRVRLVKLVKHKRVTKRVTRYFERCGWV